MAVAVPEGDRAPICQPGHLVYSAQLDRSKLECWFCLQCLCAAKKELAARSFLDVYTNGIHVNVPSGSCCCCWLDNSKFFFWDDKRIESYGKAGCCKPYPYFCPHGCNCCGEAFFFKKGCGCFTSACPLGIGHCWAMCLGCPGCCGCCITDVFCGLKPGEAEVVEQVIGKARSGQAVPIPRVPFMPAPIAVATVAMG